MLIKPTVIEKPSGAADATKAFLKDNVQDKFNLHEAMDITRTNRAERAASLLAELNPSGTNNLFNTKFDYDWIPHTPRKELDD